MNGMTIEGISHFARPPPDVGIGWPQHHSDGALGMEALQGLCWGRRFALPTARQTPPAGLQRRPPGRAQIGQPPGRLPRTTSDRRRCARWRWHNLVRSYEQVPLSHFIEHSFQYLMVRIRRPDRLGHFSLDYTVPVEHIGVIVTDIVEASQLWDGCVVYFQVLEATEGLSELRVLWWSTVLSRSLGASLSREGELISFLQSRVLLRLAEFLAQFPSHLC